MRNRRSSLDPGRVERWKRGRRSVRRSTRAQGSRRFSSVRCSLLRDTVQTMDTFEALSARVLKLYGSNHYDVALSLVETNVALFADHRATFSYWTACLLSLARAFSSLRLTCNQQPASRTTQSPGIRSAPLKPD